jgi:aminopeptidase N
MKEAQPATIYLSDYQPPDYLIDETELYVDLREDYAEVSSTLHIRRNPAAVNASAELVLQGVELELMSLRIDGENLDSEGYLLSDETLTIRAVPPEFILQCVSRCRPQLNKSMEGLYRSRTMFCTQCEAQGFRKITWYIDRPDVLSRFTTHIEADRKNYPVLLSNGNCIISEDLDHGRQRVTWEDPFRKPCYLFALVAGDLCFQQDQFTTASGRQVDLRIYVEPRDLDKCDHAMASLKHSMRWDESVYGREYDLDIFMIVAVDDFNMGAMENKGLNIFNTSCVLADPGITTDAGFQRIEAIIAHEYFHNWSGNRVTCRDWFQLSLKEGFTVFRDSQFSADMNSATVNRVESVKLLRTMQFAEDAGPTAHPIQPQSYMEISNFYTLTVYEKGAEVVRMLHTLLGEQLFRKGSDLYFERHDGEAATCDDFVAAMAAASGRNLDQFKRWYSQVGTPHVTATDSYDPKARRYTLTMEQSCAGASEPLHIPVKVGLLWPADSIAEGALGSPERVMDSPERVLDSHEQVLELTEYRQSFVFEPVECKPVPSLLRGFSAPVKLDYGYSNDELLRLMSHDSDGFNRWDAGQLLATRLLQGLIADQLSGQALVLDTKLVSAYRQLLANSALDKSMLALMLQLPSEAYLSEEADIITVDAIHTAREFARRHIADALQAQLFDVYQANSCEQAYRVDSDQMAQRSLKNQCLGYLAATAGEQAIELCDRQFYTADNMTDTLFALNCLLNVDTPQAVQLAEQALATFYQRWQHESLAVNQWFQAQAMAILPGALERVQDLMRHSAYDASNPNKVRSLVAAFCGGNPVNFHRADGRGYQFLADQVAGLDGDNPQLAARLLGPVTRWKKYPQANADDMRAALEQIASGPTLSKDVYEIVSKSLKP